MRDYPAVVLHFGLVALTVSTAFQKSASQEAPALSYNFPQTDSIEILHNKSDRSLDPARRFFSRMAMCHRNQE